MVTSKDLVFSGTSAFGLILRAQELNKHTCVLDRAVPKFMKRIKARDYKDRNVFGVPLQVIVQRSGQPLPQSIQQAMRYLRSQCLDQVRDDKHALKPYKCMLVQAVLKETYRNVLNLKG